MSKCISKKILIFLFAIVASLCMVFPCLTLHNASAKNKVNYYAAEQTVDGATDIESIIAEITADIENYKTALDSIVVVDEAYVDFGGESVVPLINKYDNLLVTQTFSKSRSMAGARLGFGVASNGLINDLMRIKYSTNPYNVNSMTAAAGYGAIKDDKYFINNCKEIIKNRDYTASELKKLGFTLTNSLANFIFAKSDKIGGEKLYQKLKEKGILVRHFSKERISDYIRITIGSFEEMQTFIQTVKTILEA